jgi:hypothetical protein
MSTSHGHREKVEGGKGGIDFTPYYFLNVFLPIFWFAYLGVAATYVFTTFWLSPLLNTDLWVPIIFYSLSTAFVALTISCTIMGVMFREYDAVRAEEIIKIPMIVAASVLVIRFALPVITTIQQMLAVN